MKVIFWQHSDVRCCCPRLVAKRLDPSASSLAKHVVPGERRKVDRDLTIDCVATALDCGTNPTDQRIPIYRFDGTSGEKPGSLYNQAAVRRSLFEALITSLTSDVTVILLKFTPSPTHWLCLINSWAIMMLFTTSDHQIGLHRPQTSFW